MNVKPTMPRPGSACRVSRLLVVLALLPASLLAASYYVSPSGSDSNPGTLSSPFKSITKAQSVASSGDTVYLRGGTYSSFTIASSDSTYHYVHALNKAGITYTNYSTEVPVFNFSSIPTDLRVAGFYITASNIHITGIQVTATPVGSQKQSECFRIYGSAASCTFTRCVCHDNAANGFYFTNHATGSCVNCDSYNNIGSSSASIGNTDGFGAHGNGVTFQYCRSWHNSDDGYDCIASYGSNTFDHCWAYNMTAGGDSNGFKIGGWGSTTPPSSVPVHTVQYCLSADNNAHGFYANHQPGQSANWTHNTSYNNAGGDFDMLERVSPTNSTDISGYREVLHYNIAYKSTLVKDDADPAAQETNNSWTKSVTVNDADFQSTDATQITRARNSDGSLPSITFMHLVSGSDLAGLGCF
ncbi:MAG TPA: DUF1565 domain-containing protein [Opitutaceae bacterium]|nr:DUF1565 domain-containing protein [Opitutaceae bacterium]